MKFKVGDRVIRTRFDVEGALTKGDVYTVKDIHLTSDGKQYGVRLEEIEDNWYYIGNFELSKEIQVLEILRQYEDFKRHSNSNRSS